MTPLLGGTWVLALVLPSGTIGGYQVRFGTATDPRSHSQLAVLREFVRDGHGFVLAVDTASLGTQILPADGLKVHDQTWKKLQGKLRKTPYGKALADSARRAALLQDAGVTHALPPGQGVVLTVDLCPAVRPLDRQLFEAVLANFEPEEKPVPLGIAITGVWMEEHPKDLAWLHDLEQSGEIAVTWINHSFNHRYNKDLPLSRNFLLEAGTDPAFEILATEKAMIERGLLPSVFFRFPGLVSDASLISTVTGYGLVPVGSVAWLAKNQPVSEGSIVLVHGNGNEPLGVERFLELLKQEHTAILGKNWLLFDLRASVAREEEPPVKP